MQYARKLTEWGEYPVCRLSVVAISAVFIGITSACDRNTPRDESKSPSTQSMPSKVITVTEDLRNSAVSGMPGVSAESHLQPAKAKSEKASNHQPPEYRPETIAPWRPLLNAAPGQWVEYESLERLRVRYEVLLVKPTRVTTQVTVYQEGRNVGIPATREDDSTADELEGQAKRRHATRSCQPAKLEVVGRQFECLLYEDRWFSEDISYVCRTWVSVAVPFLGTVRMELYGADRLEARLVLVGLGGAARSPKPTTAP